MNFTSAGSTSFAEAFMAAIINTVVAATRTVISVTVRFMGAVMFRARSVGSKFSFRCGSDDS